MQIEFDFKEEANGVFGAVMRPVARLYLIGASGEEVSEVFYVDSGADITLIPRSLGDLLGYSLADKSNVSEIKGVGGRSVPYLMRSVKIKFADNCMIEARVAWSLIDEVPSLLGRLDVFELFDIIFQKNRKTTFQFDAGIV